MEIDSQIIDKYIVPAGFLISGIIIGFIVEKILLHNVRKMAIKSRWEGGRVIINSLRGITFLWFIIGGIYFAMLNIDNMGPTFFSHTKMALAVVMIFSVTIVISKLATGFVKLYTGSVLPSTSIFTNLTKVFVFILGMLVLLQTIGISVAPIITALGVGGLAVALALQDTLSNLFAGLHIIASKKVRTGDYIKLEGGEGFLEDITWRNTSIRTLSNNTIIVPNSKMASAIITNFNIPTKDLDIVINVSASYESDLEKVEKISIEVGKEVVKFLSKDLNNNGDPVVRFTQFADSNISYVVVIRGKEFTDQGLIKHLYIKKLHERFKQEGIDIPYPTRTLLMQNGVSTNVN
jgi:small-conductance mechanosensitive channel